MSKPATLLSLRPGLAGSPAAGKDYLPPTWAEGLVAAILEAVRQGANPRAAVVGSGMLTEAEFFSLRDAAARNNAHPIVEEFFHAIEAAFAQAEVQASIDVRVKKPQDWLATGRAKDWAPATRQLVEVEVGLVVSALLDEFAEEPDILNRVLARIAAISK